MCLFLVFALFLLSIFTLGSYNGQNGTLYSGIFWWYLFDFLNLNGSNTGQKISAEFLPIPSAQLCKQWPILNILRVVARFNWIIPAKQSNIHTLSEPPSWPFHLIPNKHRFLEDGLFSSILLAYTVVLCPEVIKPLKTDYGLTMKDEWGCIQCIRSGHFSVCVPGILSAVCAAVRFTDDPCDDAYAQVCQSNKVSCTMTHDETALTPPEQADPGTAVCGV